MGFDYALAILDPADEISRLRRCVNVHSLGGELELRYVLKRELECDMKRTPKAPKSSRIQRPAQAANPSGNRGKVKTPR